MFAASLWMGVGEGTAAEPPAFGLQVPPGFAVEVLHVVPKGEQGSWVTLAVAADGDLLAGDQYGGVFRIRPAAPGSGHRTEVELLPLEVAARTAGTTGAPVPAVGAHGLLLRPEGLYVMATERPERGIWRFGTGEGGFRSPANPILALPGSGEHGAHALVTGPDPAELWFMAGNYTKLPESPANVRPVAWGEDHLLPRMWDPAGHARNRLAPGGYIGKLDTRSGAVEVVTVGLRNAYDIAFDPNGEVFTFDSDMEPDHGLPWYMPTRILHLVSGGDYGWRSSAGRRPAWHADSLPAVLNIGPGSPTGVTFGTHARFPARYQRAFFAADWTFGTLYAVHLEPDGATFRATKEEFLTGKPLPLTDLVIHPDDGAMYLVTGGRRTQSVLLRVRYVGHESTAPASYPEPTPLARLRRELETTHLAGASSAAIETVWPHLDSGDRFVRTAARVGLERQPPTAWSARALQEKRPLAAVEALLALARVGDKALQPELLAALTRVPFPTQADDQLALLRTWQLAFTRLGPPPAAVGRDFRVAWESRFPAADSRVTRELLELLLFLGSESAVRKAVPLLRVVEPPDVEDYGTAALVARNERYGLVVQAAAGSNPDRQQIAIAYALRTARVGWTAELRREYFDWFRRAAVWRGGSSFRGYLKAIRSEAIAHTVPEEAERTALAEDADAVWAAAAPAPAIEPQGPGRTYTVEAALALLDGKLNGARYERGRAMFSATACVACHRFNGEGLGVGPDLDGAGNRYSLRDLLENILEPSLVISDQHGSEEIRTKSGETVIGRVVAEENETLLVMTNPFLPDEHTKVALSEVASRGPYARSLMPPGLVDPLNPEELRDLVAYLLSGGQREHSYFRGASPNSP